jgi:hypothetical protein
MMAWAIVCAPEIADEDDEVSGRVCVGGVGLEGAGGDGVGRMGVGAWGWDGWDPRCFAQNAPRLLL